MGLFDKVINMGSTNTNGELEEYLDQLLELDKKMLSLSDLDQIDKHDAKVEKILSMIKSLNESTNDSSNDKLMGAKMRGKIMVRLFDKYIDEYSKLIKNAQKELINEDDELGSALISKAISSLELRKTEIDSLRFPWKLDAEW